MATLATLRAHDQAGLDVLPEHDAYFDVDDLEFDARLEVEVEITDHVDHHYRVRSGRLLGVESEHRWE